MAKKTVLDIVQDTLSSMGSDNVNDIAETPEAAEVADIVESVFWQIIHSKDWPHLRRVLRPTSEADAARPTHMRIQDDVQRILHDTMYYNKVNTQGGDPDWSPVHYLELDQFLRLVMQRSDSASSSEVQEVTDNAGFVFYVYNDRAPTYWTSVNDELLIFDSFDSTVDSVLQTNKAQVNAYVEPAFSKSNGHTPDLPSKVFPYFIAEVKSTAALQIAQEPNAKQEQISQSFQAWTAREKWRTRRGIRNRNNFGRK